MKLILLLLISMVSLSLKAQPEIILDGLGGIDYSHRILRAPSNLSHIVSFRDSIEKGKLGYRGGINFSIKLTKKLKLKTGIRYISNGYNQKQTNLKYESEYDPITGNYTPNPSLPHHIQTKMNYRFIEVPWGIRYSFPERKYTWFTELGITNTFWLSTKSKTITELYTSEILQTEAFYMNGWNMNGYVSFGVQYKLNKHWHYFVQPLFRYGLSPLSSSDIKEHLYSIGLEAGIQFYMYP